MIQRKGDFQEAATEPIRARISSKLIAGELRRSCNSGDQFQEVELDLLPSSSFHQKLKVADWLAVDTRLLQWSLVNSHDRDSDARSGDSGEPGV